jgi:hypothetical protein
MLNNIENNKYLDKTSSIYYVAAEGVTAQRGV